MKNKITVVFDTETTGLIKPTECDITKQPYITEIYCYKMDGDLNKIGEFEQLFKIPIPVPDFITKITGIDDNDLAGKPSFLQSFGDLAEFMTGVDVLVAHNLAFDRAMVANELSRIGKVLHFPWPREHICTVEKTLHIQQRRMSLTKMHEELFGEGFPDAHRAKNDVIPLVRCYRELVKTGVI